MRDFIYSIKQKHVIVRLENVYVGYTYSKEFPFAMMSSYVHGNGSVYRVCGHEADTRDKFLTVEKQYLSTIYFIVSVNV